MTLLLQDQLDGLQVLHEDKWINVPPVHGARKYRRSSTGKYSNSKYKAIKSLALGLLAKILVLMKLL